MSGPFDGQRVALPLAGDGAAQVATHAGAADPHTGYVLESLADAKGDLWVASAADTPARLAAGSAGQVLVPDSAQATGHKYVSAISYPSPKQHNLTGWTYDPVHTVNTNGTITAGVLYLIKCWAVASETVGNIYLGTGVAGITLANTFTGLYAADGTLLGTSTDQSANWTDIALQTCPLVAGVAVTAGTAYYIPILVGSAGTLPQFNRAASNAVASVGLAAGEYRSMSSGTGQTALPASVTMGSAALVGTAYWAAMGP